MSDINKHVHRLNKEHGDEKTLKDNEDEEPINGYPIKKRREATEATDHEFNKKDDEELINNYAIEKRRARTDSRTNNLKQLI